MGGLTHSVQNCKMGLHMSANLLHLPRFQVPNQTSTKPEVKGEKHKQGYGGGATIRRR